jgi:hypothetical protein
LRRHVIGDDHVPDVDRVERAEEKTGFQITFYD